MRETLLDGGGTPGILWIRASISANRFATACSIESLIEERLDAAVDWGAVGVIWGGWLTVGCGHAEWPIELVTNGMVV